MTHSSSVGLTTQSVKSRLGYLLYLAVTTLLLLAAVNTLPSSLHGWRRLTQQPIRILLTTPPSQLYHKMAEQLKPRSKSPLFKNRDFPATLPAPLDLSSTDATQLLANTPLNAALSKTFSTSACSNTHPHADVEPIDSAGVVPTYTQNQLMDICHECVPGWFRHSRSRLAITPLHGGMTNALYVVYLKPEGEVKVDSDVSTASEAGALTDAAGKIIHEHLVKGQQDSPSGRAYDKVVVRVFGNDTSVFFNRTFERHVTRKLLQTTAGPRVLCEFPNGRIERFINGRTLMCPHLQVPELCSYISTAIARFHMEHIDLRAVAGEADPSDGVANISFLTSPENPLIFLNIREWWKYAKTIKTEEMTYALADMTKDEQAAAKQLRLDMMKFININSKEFENEIEWLENKLRSLNSPIVFAHNDLQEGNIIVDDKYLNEIDIDHITPFEAARQMDPIDESTYAYKLQSSNKEIPRFGPTWIAPALPKHPQLREAIDHVKQMNPRRAMHEVDVSDSIADPSKNPCHLIDFEYAGWNYRAFDLANHFAEHYIDYSYGHWPYFVIVPSLLPGKQHLQSFCNAYLTAINRYSNITTPVTEAARDRLMEESLWFMLASNLMWVPWGVIQAGKSNLNFGYLEYATARYQEYQRLKDILTGDGGYNNLWVKQ